MPRFEPKNPDYRKVTTATLDRQQAMRRLGITIVRLEPGEIELSMP
jgi:acyl-coenzyme A thioesterase PaaI-like protein